MSELVDSSEIEAIVGVQRHATDHYGRAVSASQTFYILHSQECRDSTNDLRECIYSQALDHGLRPSLWRPFEDKPVQLIVVGDTLAPVRWTEVRP